MELKIEKTIFSPEPEVVFSRYLEDFDLKMEDLKDKAVLDVGSGMVPKFVEYCLENGITNKIYAIDHWPFGHEIKNLGDLQYEFVSAEGAQNLESKKHFIQAEGGSLPIKRDFKFHLILMRATLDHVSDVAGLLKEATAYLEHGGELRVCPVWAGYEAAKLQEVFNGLDKNYFDIEWRNDVVKRDMKDKPYLVIIRKK